MPLVTHDLLASCFSSAHWGCIQPGQSQSNPNPGWLAAVLIPAPLTSTINVHLSERMHSKLILAEFFTFGWDITTHAKIFLSCQVYSALQIAHKLCCSLIVHIRGIHSFLLKLNNLLDKEHQKLRQLEDSFPLLYCVADPRDDLVLWCFSIHFCSLL